MAGRWEFRPTVFMTLRAGWKTYSMTAASLKLTEAGEEMTV
jgi:hypothetical protein